MTVVSGRIVTADGVVEGALSIDGRQISAIDPGSGADQWVLPGFVDIHTHGGGGHTFTTGDPDSARRAATFHLSHGTTTILASLVSSPFEIMRDAVTALTPLTAESVLAGVHLEGPYVSRLRCGAQNPQHLRDPSMEELAELLDLGERFGTQAIRMITIAPERVGAIAAIETMTRRGIIAAVGHTDASYEQVKTAVQAGARVATHLFNAMRPVHHREPGPILALLDAPEVVCELIADGVHLHDATLAFAAHTAGPDRAALITDAMAAAGMPDGDYLLLDQNVVVTDRVARLARDGSIAGSTLTMDAAVRRALGAGLSMVEVAKMAATTPAQLLGLDRRLAVGLPADLVVLDADLSVTQVWRGGVQI